METMFEQDDIDDGDTCVWIKEELELETDLDYMDPIASDPCDPLCEYSCSTDPIEDNDPMYEVDIDEDQDSLKREDLALPIQPIVNLNTNDDDPELKLDDINAKVNEEVKDSAEGVLDEPYLYQCHECYFSCYQHANYVKHMQIHTPEITYTCPTCNKSFTFRNSYLRHQNIHQHEKFYESMVASPQMTDEAPLDKDDRFVCGACSAVFLSRAMLVRHLKQLTVEEPYPCLVCEKKFERKEQLLRHEKTHEMEMPFVCQICEARFSDKYMLAQHAITHTYEKSFLCEVCNRRFWQKERLSEHMRNFHDKRKRFECEICHYKFSRSQDMGRHKRTHSTLMFIECPLCMFSTKSHRVLARHAKNHYRDPVNTRQYMCPLCQRKISGNHKMTVHLENHAKEKW